MSTELSPWEKCIVRLNVADAELDRAKRVANGEHRDATNAAWGEYTEAWEKEYGPGKGTK